MAASDALKFARLAKPPIFAPAELTLRDTLAGNEPWYVDRPAAAWEGRLDVNDRVEVRDSAVGDAKCGPDIIVPLPAKPTVCPLPNIEEPLPAAL